MYENLHESSPVAVVSMKRVLQEIGDLKYRLTKIENEIVVLHEFVKKSSNSTIRHDNINSRLLKNADFIDNNEEVEDPRWSQQLPQIDHSNPDTKAIDVALMINNQSWYGETFLFEVISQYKGIRPKENNWYNSVYVFYTIKRFSNFILSQKWFHHTCVLSVGYSEIFNFIPITDKRVKRVLHLMLNHMREHGAKLIKVLSLPPAHQMMKNKEYLHLCQTNNRILQAVTQTHPGVHFINLDSFFVKNSGDSFNYFKNDEICVEILDNLLMKKENNEKFSIYINPESARCLIEYVSNYNKISTDLPNSDWRTKNPQDFNQYEESSGVTHRRKLDTSHSYTDDLRAALLNKRACIRDKTSVEREIDYHKSSNYDNRFLTSTPEFSKKKLFSSTRIQKDNIRLNRYNNQCTYNTNDFLVDRHSYSKNNEYCERNVSDSFIETRRKSVSPPPWIRNSNFNATASRLKQWYDLISDSRREDQNNGIS